MRTILKRTEVESENHISVRIELLGLTIYEKTIDDKRAPEVRTPIGFIQYPIDAPTYIEERDYLLEEEI